MFVHEHQAKDILKRFGFAFPQGDVAYSAREASDAAQRIAADSWVVKAQVLAGDRGRFGGIKIANAAADVGRETQAMLGSILYTPQTGDSGIQVDAVYVEQSVRIERELYLAILLDRYQRELVFLATHQGGTGIESVLRDQPHSLQRVALSIDNAPDETTLQQLAANMGLTGALADQYAETCRSLYRAVGELDALSIELNPLAVVEDDRLMTLDVKMEIDDNALFRHDGIRRDQGTQPADRPKTARAKRVTTTSGSMAISGCWSAVPDWRLPPWIYWKLHRWSPPIFWTCLRLHRVPMSPMPARPCSGTLR